jgi:hypothetical protein
MRMGNPRLAWHGGHARYNLHSDTLRIPKIRTYDYPDSVFRGERMLPIIESVKRTKSRILVFDHNMLLGEGLCSLICLQPDMDIVGVATSGSEALQLCRQHRPEVVLIDPLVIQT